VPADATAFGVEDSPVLNHAPRLETAPACFVMGMAMLSKATLARWMCHALLVIVALFGCGLPLGLTKEELAERWADHCAAWGIGATARLRAVPDAPRNLGRADPATTA
jgi:hypothetical protein